ncbi:3144_t:CDS:2, partial [Acaulospora colombiana]
ASIQYADHFCHRYTSRGVERYSGPWDVQPKNVVLVIGNQADPITPYRNAQLVTRLLGSKARLVQQAGYGHTIRKHLVSAYHLSKLKTNLTYNSTCTANTIKKYLQGTIPDDKGDDGPDVLCELDEGPFGLPGNTPWNITSSENGDKLTAGPDDPGLVNFPGLTVPPAVGGQEISNGNNESQNGAIGKSRLG